jgi:hypothetical protein
MAAQRFTTLRKSLAILTCVAAVSCLVSTGCTSKTDPIATPDPNQTEMETDSFDLSQPFVPIGEPATEAERIRRIMDSEELIRNLSPRLGQFAKRFSNKPSVAETFFAETVEYVGPTPIDWKSELASSSRTANHAHPLVGHFHWPLSDAAKTANAIDDLWKPLVDGSQFRECQFGTVSGTISADRQQFRMETLFEGKLTDIARPVGVKAKQTIDWAKFGGDWKIVRWKQTKFDLVASTNPLFEDVTAQMIPDKETLEDVSRVSLEEIILQKIDDNSLLQPISKKYRLFNDWESSSQYPTVNVVDYDNDGLEDIFLLDRFTPGMMLRNQGDGTFADTTKQCGLLVPKYGNCVFFVDFDNDGDKDAFVGRTLEPSMFFTNEDGKFQRDLTMDESLKHAYFVISGCVTDINRDGLLDLYLSTYAVPGTTDTAWYKDFFSLEDQLKMKLRKTKSPYIDKAGPANIVLMNKNGRLVPTEIDDTLRQWRNTYQTTCTDLDGDGDDDLYACNDFAPDAFLRNDTERGSMKPRFTEISNEIVPDGTMGFGMGSSWGDYDSDGDLDLYVSNMYSKAGKRILKQAGKIDPRTEVASKGNFLYQRDGDLFKQVAGVESDKINVSKVGWSFGGQFADFDNDGLLDIYVPSGFFTAPESIRSEVDL